MTRFRMSEDERRARKAARDEMYFGGAGNAVSAYLEQYGTLAVVESKRERRIAKPLKKLQPKANTVNSPPAFISALRLAKSRNALPAWASLGAIETIYRKAREYGMQVDHIVPLQSQIVCGLHCEANLQLMAASENASKRNRFWPDMP